MRSLKFGLLALMLLFAVSTQAYQRTVLVEDFTNWGCGPCAPANTNLYNALQSYTEDQVFDIAYHMNWPSASDPFYLANPSENNTRRSYYSVNSVPHMRCDGISQMSTSSSYAMQNAIDARLAVPSDIWLDVSVSIVGANIEVICTAVSDITITGYVSLHMLVLDIYSYLPNSPNGNPNHYHAMLDMEPSGSGQMFNVQAYDTSYFYATFPLDPSWAVENLDIACFVQNNTTKEVLQAKVESIPLDFPNIQITDYTVSDPTGNNDGRIDPGETGEIVVTLQNMVPFHDATNVEAVLVTEEPLIDIISGTASYPDLPAGNSATNSSDPFELYVDPDFEAHEVTFNLTVTAEPGNFEATYQITFMVGRPDIILVNDDFMGYYQSWYEESLDELGRIYDLWNQSQQGALQQDEMDRYLMVIWYTGDDNIAPLTVDEQLRIENFLDNGGRLLLSSQNAGDLLAGTTFYEEVLHAQHLENSTNEYTLSGVDGDPVSDGTSIMFVGAGGAGNANSSSSMEPVSPAVGIYTYDTAGTFGALRCQTEVTRFIYFGFAAEAITGNGATSTRTEILDNCLNWIAGAVAVEPDDPEMTLPDRPELVGIYPNPFNPTTEISFALPTDGFVQLQVYDLQGKLIDQLISGVIRAGWRTVQWDATMYPSGMYIVTLSTDGSKFSRKVVLLK